MPTTASALLDIATSFASGEEAVGAIFPNNNAKGKRSDETPEASTSRPAQKKKKGRHGKREALKAGLVAAADRKNPRGPGLFDDMLKKPCPYH